MSALFGVLLEEVQKAVILIITFLNHLNGNRLNKGLSVLSNNKGFHNNQYFTNL